MAWQAVLALAVATAQEKAVEAITVDLDHVEVALNSKVCMVRYRHLVTPVINVASPVTIVAIVRTQIVEEVTIRRCIRVVTVEALHHTAEVADFKREPIAPAVLLHQAQLVVVLMVTRTTDHRNLHQTVTFATSAIKPGTGFLNVQFHRPDMCAACVKFLDTK
jgi:hypothetical protein